MSLTRAWQSAINDKLTTVMVMNLLKRSQFINKLMQEKDWLGTGETITDPSGPRNSYVIEFLGSTIGARKVGSYQDANKIQITDPVRGLVQSYVDFTGSLKVNSKDIRQHKGKNKTQSLFGKISRQLTNIMAGHKNDMENMILNGSIISGLTSVADAASGLLTVKRPENFEIGMGVQISATGASSTKNKELFVISVNKSTKKIGFAVTLGGSAADISTFVGTAAATYICVNGAVASTGARTEGMASLESILLSSANGGDATYLGKTKTAYPFLQAAEVDGSSMNSSNFLEKLFELYVTDMGLRVKHPEQVKPKDVFLSPLNYAIAKIYLEDYKGQFASTDLTGSNPYGWEGIKVGSDKSGSGLNLFEVPALKDSIIPVLNMDTFAIVSDGGVQFEQDENNPKSEKYWYPTRATGGYTWICDFELAGQFVCGNPESNGIFYNVSMSL